MRILLAYQHHRRCGPVHFKRAFRHLGHEVVSAGWWNDAEPYGVHGNEPDFLLPKKGGSGTDFTYLWTDLPLTPPPDLFVLVDGGENLRVLGIPPDQPWVHISTEGSNMSWSEGLTPFRFAEIMANGAGPTVEWLPKAFSYSDQACYSPPTPRRREYDLVQLASQRTSRVKFAGEMRAVAIAEDLHVFFGEIWGPAYWALYRNALATYVCSGLDFVTNRVFEAMASRCLVLADPQPSMRTLFIPGKHYIEYEPIPACDGENMPDPRWVAEFLKEMRRDRGRFIEITTAAYELSMDHHSFSDRCAHVLGRVEKEWKSTRR